MAAAVGPHSFIFLNDSFSTAFSLTVCLNIGHYIHIVTTFRTAYIIVALRYIPYYKIIACRAVNLIYNKALLITDVRTCPSQIITGPANHIHIIPVRRNQYVIRFKQSNLAAST
jgi:hypothetical protein